MSRAELFKRGCVPLLLAFLLVGACQHTAEDEAKIQDEDSPIQRFLDDFESEYARLYYAASQAEWLASTDVNDAHTAASIKAQEKFSAFTGSAATRERAEELLASGDANPIQERQLKILMYEASMYPDSIPEIVKARIAAEGRQRQAMDGFAFELEAADGSKKPVTPNDLDALLRTETDLAARKRAWEAAKSIGGPLKPGLIKLRGLRNDVAREMGHDGFFSLQVSSYDMTSDEMVTMLDQILKDLKPLYEQLHCWVRRKLAAKYGVAVPRLIPAHWLGNRWGQSWPGLVDGIDLDPLFADQKPEAMVATAENFYRSMGFPALPQVFWDKSDLYALPEGSTRMKNTHASAWHLDLRNDVRSLMSVKPDFDWFTTTHHELGHIYYYIAYSNPDVPILLREGANRGFHEGIGELISLAASQQSYMKDIGVLGKDQQLDEIPWLLNEALNSVVFMPFAIGVMTHFEHDLYDKNLPPSEFNKRWWHYKAKYQGIQAPSPRGESYCDAATKTHINDDPGQYYDYALATVFKFQLHAHIAKKILKQDLRDANYKGSKETGAFLKNILKQGASRDWREVLMDAIGEDEMNGRAMLEYYAPLLEWLKKENQGHLVGF